MTEEKNTIIRNKQTLTLENHFLC